MFQIFEKAQMWAILVIVLIVLCLMPQPPLDEDQEYPY
jgi:hypothetical protein